MKKNIVIIISLIFIASLVSFGQTNVRIKRSEFKINEAGFKEAWKHVRKGNRNFEEGAGFMRVAREQYLEAYKYNSENPELNYKIGVCYLQTDNKFEAIDYLKRAYGQDKDIAPDIHLMLGRAYHLVLDFEHAIAEYGLYKSGNIRPHEMAKVNRYIEECNHGAQLISNPRRVIINNVGEEINSEFDDYNPVLTSNGSIMYFSSRRPEREKSERSVVDTKYFEDIYKAIKVDGEWQRALRIDNKKLNSKKKNKENLAISGLSLDDKTLYLYKGDKRGGDIYFSEFEKGKWRKLKPLRKLNTRQKEADICFDDNGKTAYFISGDEKTSLGGLDIYVVRQDGKGRWNEPQNLSPLVNSTYNEMGVYIDGDTLYFSSEGHNSMGGYDVFMTTRDETGVWSKPVNMGYPINSPDDDVFYRSGLDDKHAYYSANRENGVGALDIFKIIYLGAEKEPKLITRDITIAGMNREIPSVFFESPVALEIDNRFQLMGVITEEGTQKPVVSKLEFIDMEQNRVVATSMSGKDGNYQLKLPEKKNYGVEISANGYMLFLDVVDLMSEPSNEMAIRNFELKSVEVGAKVVLENIFFEFGKSTLKPESYPALDQVKKLLESNPSLRIEISGHTDNVGSLRTNMKISTERAEAVADYLIEQGIDKTRIEYKGYAFNQPIAPNNTEDGRAKNRRVEFKILSK